MKVARFDEADIERLMANDDIIRARAKIDHEGGCFRRNASSSGGRTL
jgi:3-methyladenine DNA glycosylase Tag